MKIAGRVAPSPISVRHVAAFGGFWIFAGLFALAILAWGGVYEHVRLLDGPPSDVHPYVLLNLLLCALEVTQALIILLSQNRPSGQDGIAGDRDEEIDARAEREIALLHDRLHAMRRME